MTDAPDTVSDAKARPKVFLYRPHGRAEDCAAVAYNEEGDVLGHWTSSSLSWARHDMAQHVPEGAESVWCVGRKALQERIDAGELRNLTFDEPLPSRDNPAKLSPDPT